MCGLGSLGQFTLPVVGTMVDQGYTVWVVDKGLLAQMYKFVLVTTTIAVLLPVAGGYG